MGGKTSQSSSQVSIPPEVLARYNSVNQTAQNVAQTPFQQYSTNPNAFVAPLTATQNAGVAGTNAAAGEAQPYFGAATGFALAGANPVDAAPLNTSQYMNPYLNTVLGATSAQLNQNNQQAMAGQTGSAINQGYFGGDRSGIASAVLQGQQNLAAGQVYSGIASDAYQQALAAAQQQQGVQLGAGQANRAALQGTAGTLAELGTGAQGAALQGAQAQLGAGQVEQQTQQAGDTALYNQFLQQQSYPFQTAQFLANIAEGTGALSGSTTTSTQPGGLFMSDERLKEDMQPIGKGFDGANIYRFRYKDDPENVTRLGFSAQEMARHHPEAVHSVGGFGAVDQAAATDESAQRGGFARAANDNFGEEPARMARQGGGLSEWGMYPEGANPMTIAQLLQAQEQSYAPFAQSGGLYGSSASGAPHGGSSYVPQANLPVGGLQIARAPSPPQSSPLHQAADVAGDVTTLGKDASKAYDWGQSQLRQHDLGPDEQSAVDALYAGKAGGGFVRAHRDLGGGFAPDPSDPNNDNPYQTKGPGLAIPTAGAQQHPQLAVAKPPGSGSSDLDQLGSTAGDITSLVKLGTTLAALKRGGRAGYATDGSVTTPDDPNSLGSIAANDPASLVPVSDPLSAAVHYGIKLGSAAAHGLQNMPQSEAGALAGASSDFPMGAAEGAVAATTPPPVSRAPATAAPPPRRQPAVRTGYMRSVPGSQTPAGFANATPSAADANIQGAASNVDQLLGGASDAANDKIQSAASDIDNQLGGGAAANAKIQNAAGDVNNLLGGAPAAGAPPVSPTAPTHDAGFGPAAPKAAPGGGGSPGQGGLGGFLSGAENALGGFGKAALGMVGYEGNGQWDRDKLIPAISGIAGMLAAPTRYPLVALTQGLQQGANSYMGLQQQEAGIAQTKAQTGLSQQQIFNEMQAAIPASLRTSGAMAVPGAAPPNSNQRTMYDHTGQPWHVTLGAQYLEGATPGGDKALGAPSAAAAGAPAAATVGGPPTPAGAPAPGAAPPHRDAITYQNGAYNIGPGSAADDYRASHGLAAPPPTMFAPAGQPDTMAPTRAAWGQSQLTSDDLRAQNESEAKTVNPDVLNTARTTKRQYMAIDDALAKLPTTGPGAPGAGFPQRQDAANAYVTARNILAGFGVNLPENATADQIVQAGQELDKIRGMSGPQMAQAAGQHSAHVSDLLTSILPGAQYQPEAAHRILGMMMLNNQQDIDHQQYAQQWLSHYGNYLGMNEAFDQEFGQRYQGEAAAIPAMTSPGKSGKSAVDVLRANPTPGVTQAFDKIYGNGSARLWLGA